MSFRKPFIACALLLAQALPAYAGLETLRYKSMIDGTQQQCLLSPPAIPDPHGPSTLVVYSHGMSSNYTEPFGSNISTSIATDHPGFGILSVGTPHAWGSEGALKDITNVLREVLKKFPVERVILMGYSMGGATSLLYAEKAPDDIKKKLIAVIAIYPVGDLGKLHRMTRGSDIKNSIGTATQNDKEELKNRNFFANIDKLPPHVKICVLTADQDVLIPGVLQRDIIKACEKAGVATKLLEVKGQHGAFPPQRRIADALYFAVHKNIK